MTTDPFAIRTAGERPHAGPWQVSVVACDSALVAKVPERASTVVLSGQRRVGSRAFYRCTLKSRVQALLHWDPVAFRTALKE